MIPLFWSIILALFIMGFIIWMIGVIPLPIPGWVKQLIIGIIVFMFILWMLNAIGFPTTHLRIKP